MLYLLSDVPLAWLKNELVKAGVEVYSQKYSFTYPMNLLNNRTVQAENIYAILRAPRASSTESIVITTPLRPSGSGLTPTTGSVALLISLAKEMRGIIFIFISLFRGYSELFCLVQQYLVCLFEMQHIPIGRRI